MLVDYFFTSHLWISSMMYKNDEISAGVCPPFIFHQRTPGHDLFCSFHCKIIFKMVNLMHCSSMIVLTYQLGNPLVAGCFPSISVELIWKYFLRGQLDQSYFFTPGPLKPPDHQCLGQTQNTAQGQNRKTSKCFSRWQQVTFWQHGCVEEGQQLTFSCSVNGS